MNPEIEELKEYIRIDGNEEDDILSSFLKSAKQYLLNAGVKEDTENSLYKLAIKMLVCKWYENRNTIDPTSGNTQAFALNSIITQLKCSQVNKEGISL